MIRVESIAFDSREDWLAARHDDFTASDVGALFGKHKYRTLRQIAMDKAARRSGEVSSKVLRIGHIMEPAIIRAMEVDHGLRCVEARRYLRARSDVDPFLRIGASKDYQMFVEAEEIAAVLGDRFPRAWRRHFGEEPMSLAVECKSIDYGVFEREWRDGPPLYHYAQNATQAWLGGDDGGLVVALVRGFDCDLHIYPVVRSAPFEQEVAAQVSAFWSRFEAGESQPAAPGDQAKILYPTAAAALRANLRGAAPESPGVESARVAATTAARAFVDACAVKSVEMWDDRLVQREAAKAMEKAAKGLAEEVDENLKRALAEAEQGDLPGWQISWKNRADGPRVLSVKRSKST